MATVTPQELGQLLDLAGTAQVPLRQAYGLHDLVARLVELSNQPHPIGAILPPLSDATKTDG